jgi:hypothetical protein
MDGARDRRRASYAVAGWAGYAETARGPRAASKAGAFGTPGRRPLCGGHGGDWAVGPAVWGAGGEPWP